MEWLADVIANVADGILFTLIYNQIQKPKESEDAFTDELQFLVRKIIARKTEF